MLPQGYKNLAFGVEVVEPLLHGFPLAEKPSRHRKLHAVEYQTPKTHGERNLEIPPAGKGETSTTHQFLGSMLVFGSVPPTDFHYLGWRPSDCEASQTVYVPECSINLVVLRFMSDISISSAINHCNTIHVHKAFHVCSLCIWHHTRYSNTTTARHTLLLHFHSAILLYSANKYNPIH